MKPEDLSLHHFLVFIATYVNVVLGSMLVVTNLPIFAMIIARKSFRYHRIAILSANVEIRYAHFPKQLYEARSAVG